MKYTQQEKLNILMLCEIYRALGIKNSFNPDLIEEAISTDNYWAIDWEYQGISSGEETPASVKLVVDTIDMFEILQYTYDNLNEQDKLDVAAQVEHFNPDYALKFSGFDGNNEGRYMGIARLLEMMRRSAKGDLTKNSHSPRVEVYRRMLEVFLPARDAWIHDVGISKEALIETLNARVHPANR